MRQHDNEPLNDENIPADELMTTVQPTNSVPLPSGEGTAKGSFLDTATRMAFTGAGSPFARRVRILPLLSTSSTINPDTNEPDDDDKKDDAGEVTDEDKDEDDDEGQADDSGKDELPEDTDDEDGKDGGQPSPTPDPTPGRVITDEMCALIQAAADQPLKACDIVDGVFQTCKSRGVPPPLWQKIAAQAVREGIGTAPTQLPFWATLAMVLADIGASTSKNTVFAVTKMGASCLATFLAAMADHESGMRVGMHNLTSQAYGYWQILGGSWDRARTEGLITVKPPKVSRTSVKAGDPRFAYIRYAKSKNGKPPLPYSVQWRTPPIELCDEAAVAARYWKGWLNQIETEILSNSVRREGVIAALKKNGWSVNESSKIALALATCAATGYGYLRKNEAGTAYVDPTTGSDLAPGDVTAARRRVWVYAANRLAAASGYHSILGRMYSYGCLALKGGSSNPADDTIEPEPGPKPQVIDVPSQSDIDEEKGALARFALGYRTPSDLRTKPWTEEPPPAAFCAAASSGIEAYATQVHTAYYAGRLPYLRPLPTYFTPGTEAFQRWSDSLERMAGHARDLLAKCEAQPGPTPAPEPQPGPAPAPKPPRPAPRPPSILPRESDYAGYPEHVKRFGDTAQAQAYAVTKPKEPSDGMVVDRLMQLRYSEAMPKKITDGEPYHDAWKAAWLQMASAYDRVYKPENAGSNKPRPTDIGRENSVADQVVGRSAREPVRVNGDAHYGLTDEAYYLLYPYGPKAGVDIAARSEWRKAYQRLHAYVQNALSQRGLLR